MGDAMGGEGGGMREGPDDGGGEWQGPLREGCRVNRFLHVTVATVSLLSDVTVVILRYYDYCRCLLSKMRDLFIISVLLTEMAE